jgi:cobalt-zinc-cadmium resistance protein CzcA
MVHDGTRIPLGQLATIEETFGAGSIRREAGSRRIAVEASVNGRDLRGAADELSRRSNRDLAVPPGYFVDVGGKVESQSRATRSLVLAILLALVAVFLLLYLALGNVAEVVVILGARFPTPSWAASWRCSLPVKPGTCRPWWG